MADARLAGDRPGAVEAAFADQHADEQVAGRAPAVARGREQPGLERREGAVAGRRAAELAQPRGRCRGSAPFEGAPEVRLGLRLAAGLDEEVDGEPEEALVGAVVGEDPETFLGAAPAPRRCGRAHGRTRPAGSSPRVRRNPWRGARCGRRGRRRPRRSGRGCRRACRTRNRVEVAVFGGRAAAAFPRPRRRGGGTRRCRLRRAPRRSGRRRRGRCRSLPRFRGRRGRGRARPGRGARRGRRPGGCRGPAPAARCPRRSSRRSRRSPRRCARARAPSRRSAAAACGPDARPSRRRARRRRRRPSRRPRRSRRSRGCGWRGRSPCGGGSRGRRLARSGGGGGYVELAEERRVALGEVEDQRDQRRRGRAIAGGHGCGASGSAAASPDAAALAASAPRPCACRSRCRRRPGRSIAADPQAAAGDHGAVVLPAADDARTREASRLRIATWPSR